jgi:hypothetical protein
MQFFEVAAQRDCRKTPGPKNVHKNLPQQAKKMPKCYQNVVRNTKNKALFSVFLPLSNDQFLKVDFFDSFNGSRYRRLAGRDSPPKREKPKARKKLKKRGAYPKSGSIFKKDLADRCRVGPKRPSCSRIARSVRQIARTVERS